MRQIFKPTTEQEMGFRSEPRSILNRFAAVRTCLVPSVVKAATAVELAATTISSVVVAVAAVSSSVVITVATINVTGAVFVTPTTTTSGFLIAQVTTVVRPGVIRSLVYIATSAHDYNKHNADIQS